MDVLQRMMVPTLLGLLATFPVQALETSVPVTFDQIMATLRSVRHVNARYVEHRYLHVLRTPLELRGALHFNAPDHLEKVTEGGGERLSIDGDRLTIDRGTGSVPVVIALHEHPEIGILVESIRAMLSGNGNELRRLFDVTPSGSLDHWQVVLQPRDPEAHKLLQWVRVSGYGSRITTIDTADGEGDRSEMSIVEEAP
jgi:hypothetical protein